MFLKASECRADVSRCSWWMSHTCGRRRPRGGAGGGAQLRGARARVLREASPDPGPKHHDGRIAWSNCSTIGHR